MLTYGFFRQQLLCINVYLKRWVITVVIIKYIIITRCNNVTLELEQT